MSSMVIAEKDAGLYGQYNVVAEWIKPAGYALSVYDRREDETLEHPISARWYTSKEELLKAFNKKVKALNKARENGTLRQVKNPTLLADQLDAFQYGHLASFLSDAERAYLKKIQIKLRNDQHLEKGELEFLGDAMAILMHSKSTMTGVMFGSATTAGARARVRSNPRGESATMTIKNIGRVNSRNSFPVWFVEEAEGTKPVLFDVAFQRRPEVRVGNRIEFEFAVTGRGWRIVRADFQVSLSGPQPIPAAAMPAGRAEFTTGYVTKLKGEEEGEQPYRRAYAHHQEGTLTGTLQGIGGLQFPEDVIDAYNADGIQNGLPKIIPSYGKVVVEGVQNGRLFIVSRIIDFKPETAEQSITIPLSALNYQANSVHFDMQGYRGYANINLPFDSHPTLNTLKQHFTGSVTIQGKFKKEGFWDWGGEHLIWQYLGNTAQWSESSIENLRMVIRSHKESDEVRRLIDEYFTRGGPVDMEEFAVRLSGVLGRAVTPEQAIRDYVPHPENRRQEYEWEYIDAIKGLSDAVGGRYLYIPHRSEPEFVFVLNNIIVLEIPITNKASYIFRLDNAKGLEQQLADIRAVPSRSAIYLDENIGEALGYVTRTVHRNVGSWIDRIKAIVAPSGAIKENPAAIRGQSPITGEWEENPKDTSADIVLARELALFAINDSTIYHQFMEPYERNMAHKRVQQKFDRAKAIEGIAGVAKWVQQKYWRECSGTGPDHVPPQMNKATKMKFAEEMYEHMEEAIEEMTQEILMGVRTRRGEKKTEIRENPEPVEIQTPDISPPEVD